MLVSRLANSPGKGAESTAIRYVPSASEIRYRKKKIKRHKPLLFMALGVHPRGLEPLTFGSVDTSRVSVLPTSSIEACPDT